MKRLVLMVLTLLMTLGCVPAQAIDGNSLYSRLENVAVNNGRLRGVLNADGKVSSFGEFYADSGSGYIGTFKENRSDGYGMWCKSIDNKHGEQLDLTFGFMSNGVWNGVCTNYYADGSYLVGDYTLGARNGEFQYVDAQGRAWIYQYENNERVSFKMNGSASPLFLAISETDDEASFYFQNAEGIRQAGHGAKIDDKTLYIGEMDDEGTASGCGLKAIVQEDGVHCYIGNWVQGKINGAGTYISPLGERVECEWEFNRLISPAKSAETIEVPDAEDNAVR